MLRMPTLPQSTASPCYRPNSPYLATGLRLRCKDIFPMIQKRAILAPACDLAHPQYFLYQSLFCPHIYSYKVVK